MQYGRVVGGVEALVMSLVTVLWMKRGVRRESGEQQQLILLQ